MKVEDLEINPEWVTVDIPGLESSSVLEGTNSAQGSSPISVFILMGKTGAGKSSFIRLLGGRDLLGSKPTVDAGLYSCTQKPTVYMTRINKQKVILLDTPGFDDSARENLEVLSDIVSQFYTFALRPTELQTRGIIFLHDISEVRFGGSQKKTLGILKALVGEENLGHVIVGTTRWSTKGTRQFQEQEEREQALLEDQWEGIHDTIRVPQDDKATAIQIVTDLFEKPPVVLLSQEEMLEPPHTVENTTAGRLTLPEGREELEQLQRELREHKRTAEENARRREAAFKQQGEEINRRFEEETKKIEDAAKAHESERKRQFDEEKYKLSEETKKQIEKKEKQEAENRKREEEQRAKQEAERQKKFDEENKKKEEKAKKEAEKLERELKDLKAVMKVVTAPPQLGWLETVIKAIFAWFSATNLADDVIDKVIGKK